MSHDEEIKKLMSQMSPELKAQVFGANIDPKVFKIFADTMNSTSEATISLAAMAYAATKDPAIHEKVIRSCSYMVTLNHAISAVTEHIIPEGPRADLYRDIIEAIEDLLPKTDAVFRTLLPKAVAEARATTKNEDVAGGEEGEKKL